MLGSTIDAKILKIGLQHRRKRCSTEPRLPQLMTNSVKRSIYDDEVPELNVP